MNNAGNGTTRNSGELFNNNHFVPVRLYSSVEVQWNLTITTT